MRLARARPVITLWITLHAAACMRWEPTTVAPTQVIASEDRPLSIRVTRSDGTSVVIREPRIVNDSIAVVAGVCRRTSTRDGGYFCPTTGVVALDDVSTVEVRAPAPGRTLLLLSPVALLGVMAALYAGAGGT